jgi:hypothetical protein
MQRPALLVLGTGEAAQVDAMNEWSARVDASIGLMSGAFSDLRSEVMGTQVALMSTVQEAKVALGAMHEGFRAALETHSGTQRAITEALVVDARLKFEDLERKLSVSMTQIEQWALGEGARTAQQIAGATSQMAPSLLGTPEGSPQNSPRMQPTADPIWGRQDPWRASSFGPAPRNTRGAAFETYQGPGAAAATAAGSAPTPPAAPQPVHTGGPPFREFRIDSRGWSSHQKALDAGVSPEAFQVWRERALVHLSQGRQDVRRLLSWAEGEAAAEVQARAADRAQMPDFVQVNFALHGAIMQIIGDSLLGRARCSDEHGLLLWRNLCAEWAGSAPQYRHAKAKQFQDPLRAKDMAALWSALPAWERLGEEVRTAGFDVPEWVKSAALEKLLPLELLRTLISRPELDSLAARLAWVRSQMEHARGSAQMLALAGGGRGKDAGGDVLMGALVSDPPGTDSMVWNLQAERSRVELEGDWARAAALSEAINALGKGKGKSAGKGGKAGKGAPAAWSSTPTWGGSKGTEKGSKGSGGGDAAAGSFNGACHHCGVVGHRKRECRKLDAEMAARRQGGKGGKGIYECGAGEVNADDPAGAQDGADEVWWFDSIVGSLGMDSAPAQRQPVAGPPQPHPVLRPSGQSTEIGHQSNAHLRILRCALKGQECPRRIVSDIIQSTPAAGPPQPHPVLRPSGLRLHNRFAALDEGELEDEELAGSCCGCPHGCRNPRHQKADYDSILQDTRAALAARRAQDLADGGPPVARGLRAPRPRGEPRRVSFASGWRQVGRGRAGAHGELGLLLLEGPSGGLLAAVGIAPGGERVIEVVVDSGAVASVAPLGLFPGELEPSAMSKAGRTYRAANGSPIRNLGQVRVPFVSAEGHKCNFPFQVADVEHALLSVGHLAAAGNRVELHDKGGSITHILTGKTMALTRRGGVYVLRLRVSGFPRPVAK